MGPDRKANTMSRIDVTVGVKNAAFRTGLEQMRGQAQKFGKDLKGMFGSLGSSLGGMLGLTAGVAGLTAIGKAAIDAGGEIEDMAKRLRIGTNELQGLMYAARLAGMDMGALEMSLIKLQNASMDAAGGNGDLQDAFSRLGIDLAKFVNLSPEQKMEALGVAFKNAGEGAEAFNDLSTVLGDKVAPKVLDVLDQLATQGFPSLMESARQAGQVMNEETIAALAKAGDEIDLFKNRITVSLGNILVDFKTSTGMDKLGAQLSLQFAKAGEFLLELLLKGFMYIGAYTAATLEWAGRGLYDIILSAVEALIDVINKIPGVKIDTSGIQGQKSNESFSDVASRHQDEIDSASANGALDVTYASKSWEGEIAKYERRQEREKAAGGGDKPKEEKTKAVPIVIAETKAKVQEAERIAKEILQAKERLAKTEEQEMLSKMNSDEKRAYLNDKRVSLEGEALGADQNGDELTAINKRIEAAQVQNDIDAIKDDEEEDKFSSKDDRPEMGKSKDAKVVVSSLQAIGGGGGIARSGDSALREAQKHTSLLERIATGIDDSKIKGVPWSLDE